ncbi:MAG: hypothetical protein IKA99_02550 [Clostridia bacterium]|nr:hypothetical protein [Clostridia bacterium]
MTLLRWTEYSLEDIEKFIECPQFGNSNYGKWGALKLEQRLAIKSLCYEIRDYQSRLRLIENDYQKRFTETLYGKGLISEDERENIIDYINNDLMEKLL